MSKEHIPGYYNAAEGVAFNCEIIRSAYIAAWVYACGLCIRDAKVEINEQIKKMIDQAHELHHAEGHSNHGDAEGSNYGHTEPLWTLIAEIDSSSNEAILVCPE